MTDSSACGRVSINIQKLTKLKIKISTRIPSGFYAKFCSFNAFITKNNLDNPFEYS